MEVNKENYISIVNNTIDTINQISKSTFFSNEEEYFTTVKNRLSSFKEAANSLVKDSKLLKIGIVGQVKAGKSSFLNGLFFGGKDVLPKAATPMTAGLVIIQYAPSNSYEVDYYTNEDWRIIENEHKFFIEKVESFKEQFSDKSESEIKDKIKIEYPILYTSNELFVKATLEAKSKIGAKKENIGFSDYTELQEKFEKFVGAEGVYTSVVKSITLNINDENIKDIQIVDTPGINDPVKSRERRTEEMLRMCHGVFLLSYGGSFFSQEDYSFVEDKIGVQGISKVVVLASKYDSLLLDMASKFRNNLQGALHHISIGLKDSWEDKKKIYEKIREFEMDVTSGMAFAISKANTKEHLSKEQAHIYGRLEKCFPDNFSNFDIGKQILGKISNYEGIRTKYIEGFFIKNKNSIVDGKLLNFFEKQGEVIVNEINDFKDFILNKESLLQGEGKGFDEALSEIGSKQKDFVEALRKPFTEYFESFIDNINKDKKNFYDDLTQNFKVNNYRKSKSISLEVFIKKSFFFFTKSTTKSFQIIEFDNIGLRECLTNYTKKFDQKINDSQYINKLGNKTINEVQNSLINLLSESINTDFEEYFKNTLSNSMKTTIKNIQEQKTYTNEIGDILNSIETIDLSSLNNESEKVININKGKISLNENEINLLINSFNNNYDKNVNNLIRNKIDSSKRDIDKVFARIINDSDSSIKKLINEFNKQLKESFEKDREKILNAKQNHINIIDEFKVITQILNKI